MRAIIIFLPLLIQSVAFADSISALKRLLPVQSASAHFSGLDLDGYVCQMSYNYYRGGFNLEILTPGQNASSIAIKIDGGIETQLLSEANNKLFLVLADITTLIRKNNKMYPHDYYETNFWPKIPGDYFPNERSVLLVESIDGGESLSVIAASYVYSAKDKGYKLTQIKSCMVSR